MITECKMYASRARVIGQRLMCEIFGPRFPPLNIKTSNPPAFGACAVSASRFQNVVATFPSILEAVEKRPFIPVIQASARAAVETGYGASGMTCCGKTNIAKRRAFLRLLRRSPPGVLIADRSADRYRS